MGVESRKYPGVRTKLPEENVKTEAVGEQLGAI